MNVTCPSCGAKQNEKLTGISILKGGNEHILSYFKCESCENYFYETYCDDFMTGDSSSSILKINAEDALKTIEMIKNCPDAMNKKCNCTVHNFFKSGH